MKQNPHILEGSLAKGVITLSTPIIFAMFFHSLLNIVDTFWLGKVGYMAVAAVSISWPIIFMTIALAAGVSVGCSALVARYYGAKDLDKVSHTARNSVMVGFVLAFVLAIVGLLIAPALFRFIGAAGELLDLSLSYTNIIFYGVIFLFPLFTLGATLRGIGDVKTPMIIMIAANIINMVIDPIFIFTFGWGVAGAAIATVLSNFIGLILYVWVFWRDKTFIPIKFNKLDLDFKLIKEILFIGLPASLQNVANAVGIFFVTKVVAGFGPMVVAAYGIGWRIESFGVLPVVAISMATVTVVGQNLGAKNLARAKKSGWVSAGLATAMMGIFAFLVFIFTSWMVSIFNNEPGVVKVGTELLKIRVPAFLFAAPVMVLSSAFQAFGKSHYSLIATVLRVVLMIGLAYWFSSLWGTDGIWWAITLSSVFLGIIMAVWYKLWQPKAIEQRQEI